MVQMTIMALLGPAPAVAIGLLRHPRRFARESRRPRQTRCTTSSCSRMLGSRRWGSCSTSSEPGSASTAMTRRYALLVLPVYLLLGRREPGSCVNASGPRHRRAARLPRDRLCRHFRWKLVNGLLAAATVLVWGQVGLAAAAGLLVLLVITIPLARTMADSLRSRDDLTALRQVSDQRAAEVARLASDRTRLLSEVLHAEGRERARLAESLHDGPMQRLVAMRQDMAEAGDVPHQMDAAIAETRAIISSFHPATVRELGFEASLRAAVAPFPSARADRAQHPQRCRRPCARRHHPAACRAGAGRQRRQARVPDARSTSR